MWPLLQRKHHHQPTSFSCTVVELYHYLPKGQFKCRLSQVKTGGRPESMVKSK